MTKPTLRERVAKSIFYSHHPVSSGYPDFWNVTGTVDDQSWRRLEQKCYREADRFLAEVLEVVRESRLTEEQMEPKFDTEWDGLDGIELVLYALDAQLAAIEKKLQEAANE